MPGARSLLSLDLNLLITLDVLLRERNVTRAAERLGLSQPAVSASLARLRRHFDDELLSRAGNRYHLTPLARRLVDLTPHALDSVDRVFSATADFDPAVMERGFTVVMSDYAATVLGPEVVAVAAASAPAVSLRLEGTAPILVDHITETLRRVDGIVMPHGFLSGFPHVELHRDDWVCVVDEHHPDVGEELTVDDLTTLPWVVLYDLPSHYAPSQRHLRTAGMELKVDVVVDSFLAMPHLVVGSRRIAMMQRRLVEVLATPGIRVMETPIEAMPLHEALWWHPAHHDDPAHQWLRATFQEAAARLQDRVPPGLAVPLGPTAPTDPTIDAVDDDPAPHLLDR